MTYAGGGSTLFTIADVILILALILIPMSAMASSVVKELFRALNIVGAIFLASTLHTVFARYIYGNITKNISIGFLSTMLFFVIFFLAYFLGKLIIKYVGEGAADPGKYAVVLKIFFRFITTYVILSIMVYFFHAKLKIFESAKARFSHGPVYRHLYFTGRNLLNISVCSKTSRFYY